MLMQMSDPGRGLLTQWEGFRTKVYDDGVGVLTIGVGHALTSAEKSAGTLNISGTPVAYANGITTDQVQGLLASDLQKFEDALNNAIKIDLTQNQFDALVSFCFNIGIGAFQGSSALRDINNNNLDAVPNDLRMWDKAGGVFNQGLANRRANEINLWLGQN
jgi:lysozyme